MWGLTSQLDPLTHPMGVSEKHNQQMAVTDCENTIITADDVAIASCDDGVIKNMLACTHRFH